MTLPSLRLNLKGYDDDSGSHLRLSLTRLAFCPAPSTASLCPMMGPCVVCGVVAALVCVDCEQSKFWSREGLRGSTPELRAPRRRCSLFSRPFSELDCLSTRILLLRVPPEDRLAARTCGGLSRECIRQLVIVCCRPRASASTINWSNHLLLADADDQLFLHCQHVVQSFARLQILCPSPSRGALASESFAPRLACFELHSPRTRSRGGNPPHAVLQHDPSARLRELDAEVTSLPARVIA